MDMAIEECGRQQSSFNTGWEEKNQGMHRSTCCQNSWCQWKEKEEGAALLCSAIVWTENLLPVTKGIGRSM